MKMTILVGLPGSGKTTYAKSVPGVWINQDTMGSRKACEVACKKALESGLDVVIDRTNISKAQRKVWLDISAKYRAEAFCVYFKTSLALCKDRILEREDHPTIKTKVQFEARAIVGKFAMELQEPEESEGFKQIEVKHG